MAKLVRLDSTVWLTALATVAMLVAGCDEGADDGPVERRQAAVDDFAAKPKPRRGALIRPEAVARRVQWPDAAPTRSTAIDRLDTVTVDASPVPVLVPPTFDEGATLTTGKTWYAFAAREGDVEIAVQGSSQGRLIPGIRAPDPTHTIRNNPGFVTRNEGIWSVSWTENGAAYSLEVNCIHGLAADCEEEGIALRWVDQLVLGGGQGVTR